MKRTLLPVLALLAGCGGAPRDAKPAPTTEGEPADSPEARCLALATTPRTPTAGASERITVQHVLVRHAESKGSGPQPARSRGQACLRALEARDKILAGEDFAAIVTGYSDEPGAATRDGSVGAITRQDVVPAFADAAFALSIQQLSDLVETEFGFHLILRTQ